MTSLQEPPLLDAAIVASLRELKLLARLYPAFTRALPGHLAGVQAALAAADREALRQLAHMLRGSASQLGAAALAQAFRALEDASADAHDDAHDDPVPTPAELEALVLATTAAMTREAAATPDA